MNLIDLSSIQIPLNRQRRSHQEDRHQSLIASIQARQLLHPPVVRTDGLALWLVAGERRLRAISEIYELGGRIRYNGVELPEGQVPYTLLGDLSPLEAREAELEENVQRDDLTWQERAEAEAALFELRKAWATAAGATSIIAVRDIVEELRGETTPSAALSVTRNLTLANNLHRPEVRSAKTASDAMKALLRSEESERNAELARGLGKEFLGERHTLVRGDALEWMRQAPAAEFDVILTDPPYGMGADEFGDSGGAAAGAHFYRDDEDNFWRLMAGFLAQSWRVTKPDAHLYMFCDFDKFHEVKKHLETIGWKVFRTPLLWHKPSAFRAPWPDMGPQRKYECILYAVKGSLKVTKLAPDVITYPPEENLGHQAQKPVALFTDLLARSARPGMKVLDPFCGTGPVFPAAHALSVIAVGVEMDEAACGIAAGRIQRLKGTT